MSRLPQPSEPGELLKQLAQENIPSVPEDASLERRDRLVRSMKEAVERAAEGAEKSRRLRRTTAIVAAAAGFLLLSGLLLKQWRTDGSALAVAGVDDVTGTVVLTHDGKSNIAGSSERGLRDGDALQTATGAQAHLQTPKSSIVVSESTELRVSRPSPAEERISLRRGRVDVSVDKAIETKRAVVVETPDAEVVVRGTVFDVRVEPLANATSTKVHVTRGSVWVLAQGVQVALLSAGQSWSSAARSDTSETPAAATKLAPEPVRGLIAQRAAAARDLARDSAASPEHDDAPSVAAPLDAPRAAAAESPSKEAPEPRSAAKSAKDSPVSKDSPAAKGSSVKESLARAPSAKSSSAKAAPVRRAGTLAEENRLFAAGVEARNRGDAARAAELFNDLLTTFPQSTLREVAQVERFRALKRAGQATRASTEARHYLAEHPDGAARTEARDLALDSRD
ncbi:MAG TPA: FecR family protein [Polyangiaceae bacterium]|nr:FecR family protein [Polyangiaceae bacterium]